MASHVEFDTVPVLSTARLELSAPALRDAADLFALRSDGEVQLYNAAPDRELGETLDFIRQVGAIDGVRRDLIWAVRLIASQQVIGLVNLSTWDRYHRRAEVGYSLARAHWGLGLAQEAVGELLRYGFEHMQLNRIEIWTSAANQRSLRLAERLGFKLDGTLHRRILEDDGQFHDCRVYGMLHGDWRAAAALAGR
ncbi:MAG: hypothetical protein RIQ60_2749 [Pseudomonadota bacterium]|jgi:ribosomal-protein-alanine N-acetyltransferase